MNEPLHLTAAELAYVFSYLKAGPVIGWPPDTFQPPEDGADAFFKQGRDGLLTGKGIVKGRQKGRFRFDPVVLDTAVALADPQVVIQAQRREDGNTVKLMTAHASGRGVVQMTRRDEGFTLQRQPSLAAASGAAAAFLEPANEPPAPAVRVELNDAIFRRVKGLARDGKAEALLPALVKLGAREEQARSLVEAIARPLRAGLVSVFYCGGNRVHDADLYTVFTGANGESWVVFPPAGAKGPVVVERTSLPALAARILVGITTRLALPV